MKKEFSGAYNVRDLGGIKTEFGTVCCGKLIRSSELSRLTAEGQSVLQKVVSRVIDLRTDAEICNSPDLLSQDIDYKHIPIIRATTFGITYEKSSGNEIAQMLQMGFHRMEARGESYGEHMNLLYRKFVNDEHCRRGYGEFLRLLAENPIEGGTLWHCTAGKDRCGTCTALLLWCLGADRKTIMDDYLLTNEQSVEHKQRILDKVKGHVSEGNLALIKRMLEVDESYLTDFFAEATRKFEGTYEFIKACGINESHIQMLRKNYLE